MNERVSLGLRKKERKQYQYRIIIVFSLYKGMGVCASGVSLLINVNLVRFENVFIIKP